VSADIAVIGLYAAGHRFAWRVKRMNLPAQWRQVGFLTCFKKRLLALDT